MCWRAGTGSWTSPSGWCSGPSVRSSSTPAATSGRARSWRRRCGPSPRYPWTWRSPTRISTTASARARSAPAPCTPCPDAGRRSPRRPRRSAPSGRPATASRVTPSRPTHSLPPTRRSRTPPRLRRSTSAAAASTCCTSAAGTPTTTSPSTCRTRACVFAGDLVEQGAPPDLGDAVVADWPAHARRPAAARAAGGRAGARRPRRRRVRRRAARRAGPGGRAVCRGPARRAGRRRRTGPLAVSGRAVALGWRGDVLSGTSGADREDVGRRRRAPVRPGDLAGRGATWRAQDVPRAGPPVLRRVRRADGRHRGEPPTPSSRGWCTPASSGSSPGRRTTSSPAPSTPSTSRSPTAPTRRCCRRRTASSR